MDSINFSKSDLKFLFALAITVPLLSFVSGFYVAHGSAATPPGAVSTTDLPTGSPTDSTAKLLTEEDLALQAPANPVNDIDTSIPNPTVQRVSQSNSNAPKSIAKRYIVQAGLFTSIENAKKLTKILTEAGLKPHIVSESGDSTPLFRVIVGSFESKFAAKSFSKNVQKTHAIKLFVADTTAFKLKDLVAAI